MRILSAADIQAALADIPSAVERLRSSFRGVVGQSRVLDADIPDRLGDAAGALKVTAAWEAGRHIGIRIETAFPDNPDRNLPETISTFLILDSRTGVPIALLDGPTLTRNRVTGTIALASTYLTRTDSARLLLIGAGQTAVAAAVAHVSVRPVKDVLVWSRTAQSARNLARRLILPGVRVRATDDVEEAARGADIICVATRACTPVLKGEWLTPGVHVDFIGAVRPGMREMDADALVRGRLFVDDADMALATDDLTAGISSGVITSDDIAADLAALSRGERAGRRFHRQITLFKMAGSGAEDLATAQLAIERA